ncbi:MAG TPA: hypothetical protein ENH85_02840 [Candidatus Scalindua sp.]|nr:hypothetical protein [Candidatus Scalindua sp.]
MPNGINTNNNKLKTLIQGGAIGLSILLIGLVGFIFTKYDDLANNHATEFTAALREGTRTQQKLLDSIDDWGDKIDRLDASIGKFMDYVAPEPPWANYP